MTPTVEVRLWGDLVGHLAYAPGQSQIATFEYHPGFGTTGVQISPIVMPYPPDNHSFAQISLGTFHGLPGIIADSLPDRFGTQLIDMYLAEEGVGQVTALDRLLYVGTEDMGTGTGSTRIPYPHHTDDAPATMS